METLSNIEWLVSIVLFMWSCALLWGSWQLHRMNWQEAFAEILAVMGIEDLIRFRHRLGKNGRERMVKILSEEIAEREKGDLGIGE